MNFKINVALINLNEQINFIDLEIDNQIEKCKNSIDVILKSVSEIKKIVLKSGFKVDTEEIQFFKELKPQFTSKLIPPLPRESLRVETSQLKIPKNTYSI